MKLDENTQSSNVTVAVPPFVFTAAIVAIALVFLALTGADAFYHHRSVQDFLANWFTHFLLVLALVLAYFLLRKLLLGVPAYWHVRVLEHHERNTAAKKVERLDIQNRQLRAQTTVLEQAPALIKYAIDAGHGVKVSAKGEIEVTPLAPVSGGTIITEQEPEALPPPRYPSFADLVRSGEMLQAIQERRLIIGYANKQLRYGSWLDLYSCAVAGVSGSGKTTTVLFLLYQSVLHGAKIILIDPHIHEPEESLAARLTPLGKALGYRPVDDSTENVLRAVRYLSKEVKRRKETGSKTPFLVFVIDEFNAVMRNAEIKDELAELLLSIAQEGRKFGIFAMLIGQRWSHEEIGGAKIRSSLASSLAHRFTDENQAKLLIGSRSGAKCLELETGHYLFRDTSGALCEMVTPRTDESDIHMVLSLLGRAPAPAPVTTPVSVMPALTRQDERQDVYTGADAEPRTETLSLSLSPVYTGASWQDTGESETSVNALPMRGESGESFTSGGESGESSVKVSPQEESAILHAAFQLQTETGHVTRSEIRNKLQWNNKQWGKIKATCDKFHIAE